MNLKNLITKIAVKEVAGKIQPMDTAAPRLSKKAKLAGLLGTIAAIAAAASQYLGG
jgi:hypothetical protein